MLSSLIKKTVINGDNSFTIPEKDKAIANAKNAKRYTFLIFRPAKSAIRHIKVDL